MTGASHAKEPHGFYPWVEPVNTAGATPLPPNAPPPQKASEPTALPAKDTSLAQNPLKASYASALEPAVSPNLPANAWDDTLDAVHTVARIAVVDDMACAPRVVTIDPAPVRDYVEELTRTTYTLAKEQGGAIPFMVIREVVENLIHAYFSDPVVTIFPGGNTIKFSDRGPGIADKSQAMEYGTTTATPAMKRYIRGVGSGLPYVFHFLNEKGGTLTLDDNLSQGTVVTISLQAKVEPANPTAASPQNGAYPPPAIPHAFAAPGQSAPAPAAASAFGQNGASPYQNAPYTMGYGGAASPFEGQAPYSAWPPSSAPIPPYTPGPGIAALGYPPPTLAQSAPFMAPSPVPSWPSAPPPAPTTSQSAQNPNPPLALDDEERSILAFLGTHAEVGPTDLTQAYGRSLATWSRRLQTLEAKGILQKHGQKRQLTSFGQSLVHPLDS